MSWPSLRVWPSRSLLPVQPVRVFHRCGFVYRTSSGPRRGVCLASSSLLLQATLPGMSRAYEPPCRTQAGTGDAAELPPESFLLPACVWNPQEARFPRLSVGRVRSAVGWCVLWITELSTCSGLRSLLPQEPLLPAQCGDRAWRGQAVVGAGVTQETEPGMAYGGGSCCPRAS